MNNFNLTPEEIRYQQALDRVKKIKGFYTHLIVYVVINIAIVFSNINFNNNTDWSFEWRQFSTAIFWGIGLVAHGLSVFLPSFIMGSNWEERKINEIMEKEKNNKWE
jgi:hypothetical protein